MTKREAKELDTHRNNTICSTCEIFSLNKHTGEGKTTELFDPIVRSVHSKAVVCSRPHQRYSELQRHDDGKGKRARVCEVSVKGSTEKGLIELPNDLVGIGASYVNHSTIRRVFTYMLTARRLRLSELPLTFSVRLAMETRKYLGSLVY